MLNGGGERLGGAEVEPDDVEEDGGEAPGVEVEVYGFVEGELCELAVG